jgi:hypothetical protein
MSMIRVQEFCLTMERAGNKLVSNLLCSIADTFDPRPPYRSGNFKRKNTYSY